MQKEKKKNLKMFVYSLIFTTSTAAHIGWQAVAARTEEQCGPDSGPPCPCPSGWVAPH